MKLKELGELALLGRLASRMAKQPPPAPGKFPLALGIGDDTAAWHTDQGLELCTTDTLVEGVHFTLDTASWPDLGWKALAVNLSDIAAMGGIPLYALVTLGLPGDTEVGMVEALYDGMLECSAEFGGTIVGGDLVRSSVVFITIAMTGVTPGPLLTRSSACLGEQVAVTRALGASSAWLAALHQDTHLESDLATALRQAHLRPQPCLAEGQALRAAGVRCAMDISDGLIADLKRLCQASGVAARLQAPSVPIHPAARLAFPGECLPLALTGGEEYALLFTTSAETLKGLIGQPPSQVTSIGQIVEGPPGQVTVVGAEGEEMEMGSDGWDHFHS